MIVALTDSPEQNRNEDKPILTYLIDEHESAALDDVFDELFNEVIKQLNL